MMNGFRIVGTQLAKLCPAKHTLFLFFLLQAKFGLIFSQSYLYQVTENNLDIEIQYETDELINSLLISFSPPYQITSVSGWSLDLASSWLCTGGNCTFDLDFNEQTNVITLEIDATESRTGSGQVALIKGIIIEIEDLERHADMAKDSPVFYPNPAKNHLFIKGLPSGIKVYRSFWLKPDGQTLPVNLPNSESKKLDVSTLPRGTYFLILETDIGQIKQRVILL